MKEITVKKDYSPERIPERRKIDERWELLHGFKHEGRETA